MNPKTFRSSVLERCVSLLGVAIVCIAAIVLGAWLIEDDTALSVAAILAICVFFLLAWRSWTTSVSVTGDRLTVRNLVRQRSLAWDEIRMIRFGTMWPSVQAGWMAALVVETRVRRRGIPIQASAGSSSRGLNEKVVTALRHEAEKHGIEIQA